LETLKCDAKVIVKDKALRAKLAHQKKSTKATPEKQQEKASVPADQLAGVNCSESVGGVIDLDAITPILQCWKCAKVFKSGPGLKYHVRNVCILPEYEIQREAPATEQSDTKPILGSTVSHENVISGKRKRTKITTYTASINDVDEEDDIPSVSTKKLKGKTRKFSIKDETDEFVESDDGSEGSTTTTVDDDDSGEEGGARIRRQSQTKALRITRPANMEANSRCVQPTEYVISKVKASEAVKRCYLTSKLRFLSEPHYALATSYLNPSNTSTSTHIVSEGDNRNFLAFCFPRSRRLFKDQIIAETVPFEDWLDQWRHQQHKVYQDEAELSASNQSSNGGRSKLPELSSMINDLHTGFKHVLKPYTSVPLQPDCQQAVSMDVVMNAAGPVWAVAVAPRLPSVDTDGYYLAVGTSRIGWIEQANDRTAAGSAFQSVGCPSGVGSDPALFLGRPTTHVNIVQLWFVPTTENKSAELCYVVGLKNRGTCLKMGWSAANNVTLDVETDVVGVLSVVCGDGSVVVLVLPTKGTLKQHPDGPKKLPEVIPERCVCRWMLQSPGKMILSADWNPHIPGQILCGMQDGTITFWDILSFTKSHSPTGPDDAPEAYSLATPQEMFLDTNVNRVHASLSAVTSVKWCPYHPQLFASVGYDGAIKVCVALIRVQNI
jgi:WD40 repeat protein